MDIQPTPYSPIVNRFHTEAATAGVNEHVSKSQISGLLKAITNTDENLTIDDCKKMRESVGELRRILVNQNSKMQNKKAAGLAKIDGQLGKIINNQLEVKSILKKGTTESGNGVNPSESTRRNAVAYKNGEHPFAAKPEQNTVSTKKDALTEQPVRRNAVSYKSGEHPLAAKPEQNTVSNKKDALTEQPVRRNAVSYKSGEHPFAAKPEQSNNADANQEVPQRRNGILKAETSQSVGGSKLN